MFGNFKAFKWMKSIENHSVNVSRLENELANDFVNDIANDFVNDIANDFVNTKVNTKSRNDNDNRKHSTKRTKSIENKSVVLSGVYLQPFWGYLYPFCSTFFTFFTLFSILFHFLRERRKTRQPLSTSAQPS